MKSFGFLLGVFMAISSLVGSADTVNADTGSADQLTTEQQKVSYVLGHRIGADLKKSGAEFDAAALAKGINEATKGVPSSISEEESEKLLMALQKAAQTKMQAEMSAAGAQNSAEGTAYLAENAKKEGVKVLPSGLQYKVINEGTGEQPKADDKVRVHYRGTLINGTEFDSSYKRGQPAEFGVGQVIKGWTEALQLMKTGAKWQLTIPSNLAYGERGAGAGGAIGPDATLLFDVELLAIVGK